MEGMGLHEWRGEMRYENAKCASSVAVHYPRAASIWLWPNQAHHENGMLDPRISESHGWEFSAGSAAALWQGRFRSGTATHETVGT